MSVSTCSAVKLPSLVLIVDFLAVELSEIEIVMEYLVDCVCFADTLKSLFYTDFSGKSVLRGASFEELLLSLGSNISEMLEESI